MPQGSCLEPLLFLLSINDMPLRDSKITISVNDASLAYASNSIDDITKSINTKLENLRDMAAWKQTNLKCCKSNIHHTRHKEETASKQQWEAYKGAFQNIRRSN